MGNNKNLKKCEKIAQFWSELRELGGLLWQAFSIRVLKNYFGIENKAYMAWHDRRAYHLQVQLDMEHCTNYAPNQQITK